MSSPFDNGMGSPMTVERGVMSYSGGGAIGYDIGGAVDDGDDDNSFIQQVFAYGRKKHGLDQMAGGTPMVPGNQSESGAPRPLPMPGPLPPTSNPFGKRQNPMPAGKMAGAIPMAPGSQSETGLPRPLPEPGALPPTSNPFGKRTTPPVKVSGDVIPMRDGSNAKGMAGQFMNWRRDRGIPDDDTNVVKLPPPGGSPEPQQPQRLSAIDDGSDEEEAA